MEYDCDDLENEILCAIKDNGKTAIDKLNKIDLTLLKYNEKEVINDSLIKIIKVLSVIEDEERTLMRNIIFKFARDKNYLLNKEECAELRRRVSFIEYRFNYSPYTTLESLLDYAFIPYTAEYENNSLKEILIFSTYFLKECVDSGSFPREDYLSV